MHIPPENVNKLLNQYRLLILGFNLKLNLVSRRDAQQLIPNLISESFLPLAWDACRLESPLLDIGSGAGVPGIPLKIARPDLKLTLVESNRRKAAFLRHAVRELGLVDVEVICERAERVAIIPEHQTKYRTLTSRAAAPLTDLLDWGRALLQPGGELLVWKGKEWEEELQSADLTSWAEPSISSDASALRLIRFVLTG